MVAAGLALVATLYREFFRVVLLAYRRPHSVLQADAVYVVLLGAQLNSELELQTVQDSTAEAIKPLGRRGAFVADHNARE